MDAGDLGTLTHPPVLPCIPAGFQNPGDSNPRAPSDPCILHLLVLALYLHAHICNPLIHASPNAPPPPIPHPWASVPSKQQLCVHHSWVSAGRREVVGKVASSHLTGVSYFSLFLETINRIRHDILVRILFMFHSKNTLNWLGCLISNKLQPPLIQNLPELTRDLRGHTFRRRFCLVKS